MDDKQIGEFMYFAEKLTGWFYSHTVTKDNPNYEKYEFRKAFSALEALVLKALNIRSKRCGGKTYELVNSAPDYHSDSYAWYLGRETLFRPEYVSVDHIYDIFPKKDMGYEYAYYYTDFVETNTTRYAGAVMHGDVGWEWQNLSLSLCFEHGYDYDPALFEPGSNLTEEKALDLAKGFVRYLEMIVKTAYDYDDEDDGEPLTDEEWEEIEDMGEMTPRQYRKNCISNEASPEEIAAELMKFIEENELDVPPAFFFQECLFDSYGMGYEGMLLFATDVYASKTLGYIVKTYKEHPEIHTEVLDMYVRIVRGGGSHYSYTCLAGDTLYTYTETGKEAGCIESDDGEIYYYWDEHVNPVYAACRMIEDLVAQHIREEVERCSKTDQRSQAS